MSSTDDDAPPVIGVERLVKSHGGFRVLDGVDLTVRRGEVAALIGPSGGGKSTLLRCLNGLEAFEAGRVVIDGVELSPAGQAKPAELIALRRRVGMVFQQFHLFAYMSVIENVMAGPVYALGTPHDQARPAALALLERVGLKEKADDRPESLSGGQQQRVAVARALAVSPTVILFDEPTSALDPVTAHEVLAVIGDLAAAGQTMAVVTHAMDFARRVADAVHVMSGGKVVESGPPAKIFGEPADPVTQSFLKELS